MKQFKWLLAAVLALITCEHKVYAQTMYNPKNIDKTATTFFDGQQTFRALEYYTDQQLSNKVFRLETLAENGFPAINLQGISQGSSVYFEDKMPYNDQFTDNQTPYLSSEATQIFSGFQRIMKVFDQRFSWKGCDGNGIVPIEVKMKDLSETNSPSTSYYSSNAAGGYFGFERNLKDNKPFEITIDALAHEMTHSILRYKTGIYSKADIECSEFLGINEGICNVFGVYIKNKINNSTPQNYDWLFLPQIFSLTFDIGHPKTFEFADTYNGEYYPQSCPGSSPHEAGGPVSRWFYLLSVGSQGSEQNDLGYEYSNLTGIGVEKAIQILWNAIPSLKSFSDYPALKTFTLKAAEQLYSLNSVEYQAVDKAWCAVGVCDNNLPAFSMSPANATGFINPWPTVDINLTWTNNNLVQEWEVQMSPKYDFSDSVQTVKLTNFTTVIGPNQTLMSTATAKGYFHPSQKVYARAKISQAGNNFCKGLNPLCILYKKFSPTHAFWLKDQKAQFWPSNTSWTVKPWSAELSWKTVPDAQFYQLQVATDNAFNNLVWDGLASHTGNFTESGKINAILEIGKTYYFRVRAKRFDIVKIQNNNGAWSKPLTVNVSMPSTAITQAKNQKPNDPPLTVSPLGRQINWDPVAGATNFVVQVSTDNAFNNIVWTTTLPGNSASTTALFPPLPNLTDLFIQVLPRNGSTLGTCSHVLRAKTDENAALPVMKSPVNGSSFPFKDFAGNTFEWESGTLNMNTVHHSELHITEFPNLTSIFTTQGKNLSFFVQDPLMFDSKKGFKAAVRAVNSLGAKSALSFPFDYNVCPDHPAVFFPGDLGKVDPTKDFKIEWHPSEWFDPGSQFLVTIKENGSVLVPGFNNKPTTANFMSVPAGTLSNGKNYTVTVKNSSSCPAILLPTTFFSAVGSGSINQPQPPKLVDFNIELNAFRNDLDGLAWETSDYVLGIELIDPDGNVLGLFDANLIPVTQLSVDSENSGVIMTAKQKPEGKYKLRLKMLSINNPLAYYPFDQPRFSVLLNGQPVVSNHVITVDFANPNSSFNEWQVGFQWEIILDIK